MTSIPASCNRLAVDRPLNRLITRSWPVILPETHFKITFNFPESIRWLNYNNHHRTMSIIIQEIQPLTVMNFEAGDWRSWLILYMISSTRCLTRFLTPKYFIKFQDFVFGYDALNFQLYNLVYFHYIYKYCTSTLQQEFCFPIEWFGVVHHRNMLNLPCFLRVVPYISTHIIYICNFLCSVWFQVWQLNITNRPKQYRLLLVRVIFSN